VIDGQLGRSSPYAAESLVHVDTVSSTFPFLPDGWEQRLVPFGPGTGAGRTCTSR